MSKMIPATCVGGIVTADDVPVPSAVILSEGVAESEGVLFLDGENARYLPKTSPDLKLTLEKLAEALDKIATAMGEIATAIPTLVAPPTWATPATNPALTLATLSAEITTLKEALR